MPNINLVFVGPTGLPCSGSIQRLADGLYRQFNSEAFIVSASFADKAFALPENGGENAGTYKQTVVADTWLDGLYQFFVHNTASLNICIGSKLFAVKNGAEVPKGYETSVLNVYHADIQYTRNGVNGIDEYTVTWFKNGAPLLTGVSNITLQATNRADGANLFGTASMIQIGTTGSYKLDVSGSNLQQAGNNYIVTTTATIDGLTRAFSAILGRDV